MLKRKIYNVKDDTLRLEPTTWWNVAAKSVEFIAGIKTEISAIQAALQDERN